MHPPTVVVRFECPQVDALVGVLERFMSKYGAQISETLASANAAVARVQEDVADLRAKYDALAAKAENEVLTEQEAADLARIKPILDAVDPIVAATLPPADGQPTT
jgi:hypothetical protein